MIKSLLAAVAVVALSASVVSAEEKMIAPAPAATPAEAAASAATEAAADAEAVAVKETTLKDGTKIVIEGDAVSVVGADGTKTAAPDGNHILADGTEVTTKEGKIVAEGLGKDEPAGDDQGHKAAH